MRTLDRYLLKEYISVFATVLFGVSAIMAIVVLFDELDTLLKYKPGFILSIKFVLYTLPQTIAEIVPVIMLLSAFYFLHRLNGRNELSECFVAGFSPARLLAPILVFGVLASVGFFYAQEKIVSHFTIRAQDILEVEIKGGQRLGRAETGNWLRGTNNRMYHVPLYDTEEEILHGVWMAIINPNNMNVRETYRAEKGFYKDNAWWFENGLHCVMSNGRISKQESFDLREMDLDEEPEDFAGVQLSPSEMGFFQMRELIRNLGLSGGILRRYRAEMAYKLALPWGCFVLTLVGMAWSLRPQLSGVSMELLGTLLIGVLYMAFNALFLSLGGKGVLPPSVAGWFSTVLFLGFGSILLARRQYFPFM